MGTNANKEELIQLAERYVCEFIESEGHPGVFAYRDGLNSALRSMFPSLSPKQICDIMIHAGALKVKAGKDPELFLPNDFPQELEDKAVKVWEKMEARLNKPSQDS